MLVTDLPDPLGEGILQSEKIPNPYADGRFRSRKFAGAEEEVQEISVVIPRPSFPQRMGNLFWSAATACVVVAVVKHYDKLEGAIGSWMTYISKGVGL
jgi:hypothetical protein